MMLMLLLQLPSLTILMPLN